MIETGLRDRIVIVTGGATGIGRATVEAFAREGCRVAVWDVDRGGGEAVVEELSAGGADLVFQEMDVADVGAVEAAAAEVAGRWGGVDVLVNNAGIVRDSQLVRWKDGGVDSRMSDAQWDAVIGVNLKGVFNCTRAVVPHMIPRGGGVILNASSVVGLYGNFGQTNYVAAKAGVVGMTRTWARELGRHRIRVNAVAPGFVRTGMLDSIPPKVLEGMIAHTPIGRPGEPADVANAYLWLASDAASFVTGTVLSVDGGLVVGT